MSSVFRAIHDDTDHEVAVKVLPRTVAKNSTLLQRFLREAKSAESLEHPNIVSIFDRGVDQGRYYLVLEYVPGGDLHDYVREHGPLGIAESVEVIRGVAEGLRFAASRGLIHRDVKPANLLRAPDGKVKIIDLGLALQADNEDERVTREGTTVGTVDYMSPEQARDSRATSIRSDIYSLGCTFYYLLTGSPPFPGGDIADKLTRHCTQPPPDVRRLRPEVPWPLSQLIQRMMAKRSECRFNSYEELTSALDTIPTEPSLNGVTTALELLYALVAEDDEDSDDAIELELAEPEPTPSPPRVKQRDLSASQPSFSIAELAAIDADSAPRPAARRPPSSVSSVPAHVPKARPEPDPLPGSPVADALIEDEEPVEGKLVVPPPEFFDGGMDPATKRWIKKLVAAVVARVLLVISIDQLVRSGKTSGTNPQGAEGNQEPSPVAPEILVTPMPAPRPTN
jgi:eukaryotic-like serine/threonine-protein kinase